MKKILFFICLAFTIFSQAQINNKTRSKEGKEWINPVKLTKEEKSRPYMDEVLKTKDSLTSEEAERRRKNIAAGNPFAKYGYYPKVATLSKGKYLEFHDKDSIVVIGSVKYNTKSQEVIEILDIDLSDPDAQPIGDTHGMWMSPDPLSEEFPSWSPYSYAFNNPIRNADPTGMAPEDWVKQGNRIFFDPSVTGNSAVQTKYGGDSQSITGYHVTQNGTTTHYDLGQDGSITTTVGSLDFLATSKSVYSSGNIETGAATIEGLACNTCPTMGPIPDSRGKTDIQMLVAENPLVQDAVMGAATGGLFNAFRRAAVATETAEGAYSFYHGLDAAGEIKYVGITKQNPLARFAQHAAGGGEKAGLFFETQATGLSKSGARILEQNAINQFGLQKNGGQLLNKINSISPKKWGNFTGIIPPNAY